MTYLLDTDHLSILQRRGGAAYAVLVLNLNNHPDSDIGVSVVSLHEQAMGCNNLVNNFRRPADVLLGYELLANAIEDFRRFAVAPFGTAAQAVFDQLKASKIRVGTMDLKIAAIALAHDALLLSANLRDFQAVPDLRVENWLD